MTTYTAIADTEIDAESPVTEELMTRLRDNPIALAEGATGAPRIWGSGIARPQDMPTLTVTAADTVECQSSCDTVIGTISTTSSANPPTVVARQWTVQSVTGTVRVNWTQTNSASGRSGLYVDGVLQGALEADGTGSFDYTRDITIVPTDVIEIRHANQGSGTSSISGIEMTASNGYVVRSPYVAYDVQDVE